MANPGHCLGAAGYETGPRSVREDNALGWLTGPRARIFYPFSVCETHNGVEVCVLVLQALPLLHVQNGREHTLYSYHIRLRTSLLCLAIGQLSTLVKVVESLDILEVLAAV